MTDIRDIRRRMVGNILFSRGTGTDTEGLNYEMIIDSVDRETLEGMTTPVYTIKGKDRFGFNLMTHLETFDLDTLLRRGHVITTPELYPPFRETMPLKIQTYVFKTNPYNKTKDKKNH